MSKKNTRKTFEPEVEVTNVEVTEVKDVEDSDAVVGVEVPEIIDEPIKKKIGVIVDCDILRVRALPDAEAEVVGKANKGSEIEIDMSVKDKMFYKVTTELGIEGYCMKKYVSVKEN